MCSTEQEALTYITKNEGFLLSQLDERETKIIFQNENTQIKVIKDGRKLITLTNHYGDKELTTIFKDMIHCKLF